MKLYGFLCKGTPFLSSGELRLKQEKGEITNQKQNVERTAFQLITVLEAIDKRTPQHVTLRDQTKCTVLERSVIDCLGA